MFIPSVIEKVGNSSKAFDLPTKLLNDRIIYFSGEVTSESANICIMQLLWLNADDPETPISLYINSEGGSVLAGLAIKDIIDVLEAKVNTVGLGLCASMGAYLLSCGTGTRKATKSCRIMLHSTSSRIQGNYHDILIESQELKHLQDTVMQDLCDFTKGRISLEELQTLTLRDKWLSAQEAIELGFIDEVVS